MPGEALRESFSVAAGAAVGANARYWLGLWFKAQNFGPFPWATLVINVSGSLLIGVVASLLAHRPVLVTWQLFAVVGVLGGYTTFSTFSLDLLNQVRQGQFGAAATYALGSVALGMLSCAAGYFGVNLLVGRPA